jgi:HEAT repeat protein
VGGENPALKPEVVQRKADELVALVNAEVVTEAQFNDKGMRIINELRANHADLVLPGLLKQLKADYIPTRTRAAKTFRYIGTPAQSAIPQLFDALNDPEAVVRQEVIFALGRICWINTPPQPKDTPKVVRALIPSLKDGTDAENDLNRNRLFALQALGNIGPAAAEAVPAIILLLNDKKANARSNAALALGNIGGTAAAKAIPTLEQLATADPDDEVRRNAKSAVEKIRGQK